MKDFKIIFNNNVLEVTNTSDKYFENCLVSLKNIFFDDVVNEVTNFNSNEKIIGGLSINSTLSVIDYNSTFNKNIVLRYNTINNLTEFKDYIVNYIKPREKEFNKLNNGDISIKYGNVNNYIDLKYIGSPRLITIIYPDGDNIYSDLLYIMRLPNENKQILYLLLGNELLDDEYTRIQNLDDNDFNIYNICNQFDFNQNRFYPGINRLEPLPIITHQQAIDRKYFVILAFIAIQNAKDFINTWDEIGRIHDSHFFNKWYQLYLDNDNISSWLFNMWCDLMGKFSNNNLNCTIPLHLLMLINSLYDRTANKLQSIINAYKPCLINQLFIILYNV